MIKKIEIQNVFGIKNLQELNFEAKHLKENQIDFENGIIKEKKYKLMLTPTLIGKNAIGKTSLLKAIKFADNINSMNELLNTFFIDIEKELEEIDMIISKELFHFYQMKNNWKNHTSFIYHILIRINKNVLNGRWEELIKKVSLNEEKNVYKKNSLLKQLEYLKEIVFDQYEDLLKNENIINSKNILYSNFLLFKKEKKEILIKIEYTNSSLDKKILFGNTIEFNNQKNNKNEINNLFYEKFYKKINNLKFFEIFSTIEKMDNKKYFLRNFRLWEKFKNILNEKFPNNFNKEFINKKSIKRKWNNFLFIDDDFIKAKANIQKWNTLNDDFVLNNLITNTSNEFINKIIKKIDPTISHVELKDNGLYHIVDIENNIKSFNILSYGTIKIIIILNELINCSKNENKTILIDEIENGLNLSLIKLLIESCTNKKINTKNTQLIITTHNPAVFGNNIINKLNSFIFYDNKFINIWKLSEIIKRTEDQKSIFKNKNYYNEYFWEKKSKKKYIPNTLFNEDIYFILDSLERIK